MTQRQIRQTASKAAHEIRGAAQLLEDARRIKAASWDPLPLTPARRLRWAVSAREAARKAIQYCESIERAAREVERLNDLDEEA